MSMSMDTTHMSVPASRFGALRRSRSTATPATRDDASSDITATRWLFVLFCVYLVSQAYTVPVLTIGPWALWPGVPDVVFCLMVAAWFFTSRPTRRTQGPLRRALPIFVMITAVGAVSYVVMTVLMANLNSPYVPYGDGVVFGSFELLRLVQTAVLLWMVLAIPLTEARLAIIRRILIAVLVIVCVLVIATFFEVIQPSTLAPQLPAGREEAGAWWLYVANTDGYGLGTISYTHAYVAAHITLLLGLVLHLRDGQGWFINAVLILLAVVAVLLSGSRAGFATLMIVPLVFCLMRPLRWWIHAALVAFLIGASAIILAAHPRFMNSLLGDTGSIVEHQMAAFAPADAGNLVGRDAVWSGYLSALNDEPVRWLTGWGLGSSVDVVSHATTPHMFPLQIIVELGVVTLVPIVFLFWRVMRSIWKVERSERPFFWATVALLVSSATQETFYPTPSTGYFLGFFLVSLVIVFRPRNSEQSTVVEGVPVRVAPGLQPARSRMPSPLSGHMHPGVSGVSRIVTRQPGDERGGGSHD